MSLKVAIPNKGRLSEKALELLHHAGVSLDYSHERKLFATARGGEVHVLFVRAADIPEYVQDGVAHVGVTGLDIVEETGKRVEPVLDLGFGHCRLVVAAPQKSGIAGIGDVPHGARVATSFPNLTRRYFQEKGVEVEVVEVSGAAEITPQIGVADIITDLTSTGSTLAMNHLREVDTILESSAHLVASEAAREDPQAGERIRELAFALESVVAARGKRYLMANVPQERLEEVKKIIPGLNGPTVIDIDDHGMVAAHAVVDNGAVYDTVNRLKALGAEGILVLPIQRMVP